MAAADVTIAIVEDDRAIRSLETKILGSLGFRVVAVHSAEAAQGVLKAMHVDLVLLDISLPGRSGVEFLETVVHDYPDTATIMVSGIEAVAVATKTLRLGAYDYVTKPFAPEELEVCVKRVLGRRRLERENRAYQENLERLVSERTRALEQALREINDTYDQTIAALGAALDLRDTDTNNHCVRVAAYAVRLAEALGVDDAETIRSLRWGAYLHDIGKIGIPDSVLRKPGRLSPDEYDQIKQHPVLGKRMLDGFPFLHDASLVVYSHHERYDGTGYPQGLRGDEIPLTARIFSVADTVDAMRSDRPYRSACDWSEVRAELTEHAGQQLDPGIVEAFLSVSDSEWEAVASSAEHWHAHFAQEPPVQ
ncbi:MAG: HD domain-containing phosphohydrolase [Spirochaetota bacterium]